MSYIDTRSDAPFKQATGENPKPKRASDQALDEGSFLDTIYSNERKIQRGITLQDIEEACRNGFHEKRKDSFNDLHNTWKYAIRGKTDCGERTLRIIVSFEEESQMLIITAIDLG